LRRSAVKASRITALKSICKAAYIILNNPRREEIIGRPANFSQPMGRSRIKTSNRHSL
jgi:hypothetical protein